MSLAKRSARRRGMLMGAAIANSRSKKAQAVVQSQASAAQPVPTPAQADDSNSNDNIKYLKELADLRDAGILTEEEFSAKKKQVLGL